MKYIDWLLIKQQEKYLLVWLQLKIMKNWKNNELNKNGTLLSISKRQVKNKCDNIGREETMTKYLDVIKINDYIDFMVC